MYKILLRTAPTTFAFLSGLLVSVSTNAAAQIAFAEKAALNRFSVLISGALALVAGILWFIVSEQVASAVRKIDELAPVLRSREAAVDSLPSASKRSACVAFLLACAFSLAWPWVALLGSWVRKV